MSTFIGGVVQNNSYTCVKGKTMHCVHKDHNGVELDQREVCWRQFVPDCPAINFMCNPIAGAFVAATTVCQQSLWT